MKTNIKTLDKWHKLWLGEPGKVRFRYKQDGRYTKWDVISYWNLHDNNWSELRFEFKLA